MDKEFDKDLIKNFDNEGLERPKKSDRQKDKAESKEKNDIQLDMQKEEKTSKKKKSKININKKQAIIIALSVFLALIIIPTTIYCIVEQETPWQMLIDIFTPTDEQIIGKWQCDENNMAYEFYDDGTFDVYASILPSSSGRYELKGDELTLFIPGKPGNSTYKVTATETKLTMLWIKDCGNPVPDSQQKLNYKKVSHIKMKSMKEFVEDLTEEAAKSNKK